MEILQEYETQEVMQYAITLIKKIGFVPSKQENNTKTWLFKLVDDFDRAQTAIQRKYGVEIDLQEVYSEETVEEAENVLQYFSNIDTRRLTDTKDMFKIIKEVSLNYFSTAKEFGTICFMYHTYKRRMALLEKENLLVKEQELMLI